MTSCEWVEEIDGEFWDTSCGEAFSFLTDGPHENHFKFCCYCGKPLVFVTASQNIDRQAAVAEREPPLEP